MACYGPAELAEELACPICFEDYDFQDLARVPKLLDCRHTFCGPCITRSIEDDGSLECCICRLIHKNIITTDLIDNYVITNHLKKIQEQKDHEMALQLQQDIDRIEEENRKKELEEKRRQEEHDAAVARKEEEERQRALERASSSSQTPVDVAVQQHLGQVLSELYSISGHKSSTDVIENESDESFDSVVAFIEQITELQLDKDLGKQRLQEIITQQQQQLLEDAESQQVLSEETTENITTPPVDSVDNGSVDGNGDDDVSDDNADEEEGDHNESDLESNESFHTVDEDNSTDSVLIIENEANNISKTIIVLSDSDFSDSENGNDNIENNNKNCDNISSVDSENSENIPVVALENNENIPPVNSENNENIPPFLSEIAPRPPLRRSKRAQNN